MSTHIPTKVSGEIPNNEVLMYLSEKLVELS